MTKKTFKRAFRDSLPIMAGYLALGIGYGVLLQSKGYSFWWAILMSVTMFAGSGQYLIFGLTDETYSITATTVLEDDINPKRYYLFLTALNHSYWITGCVLGAVLGMFLPFSSEGIDFAMTALFIVIMVEQWLSSKEHLPAILGVATTVVCLLVFGAEYFIVPALFLIAAELMLFRKKLDKPESEAPHAD